MAAAGNRSGRRRYRTERMLSERDLDRLTTSIRYHYEPHEQHYRVYHRVQRPLIPEEIEEGRAAAAPQGFLSEKAVPGRGDFDPCMTAA